MVLVGYPPDSGVVTVSPTMATDVGELGAGIDNEGKGQGSHEGLSMGSSECRACVLPLSSSLFFF